MYIYKRWTYSRTHIHITKLMIHLIHILIIRVIRLGSGIVGRLLLLLLLLRKGICGGCAHGRDELVLNRLLLLLLLLWLLSR